MCQGRGGQIAHRRPAVIAQRLVADDDASSTGRSIDVPTLCEAPCSQTGQSEDETPMLDRPIILDKLATPEWS